MPGRLCLETGAVFDGFLIGAPLRADGAGGEVVFNTCMTGYQEVISDPSYAGQIVVMTYPMIGNYGCRHDARESHGLHCRALIIRSLSQTAGHPRADVTLDEELKRAGISGLTEVDTRALTRHLRDQGTVRAVLVAANVTTADAGIDAARHVRPLSEEHDLVASVSQSELTTKWTERLPAELERGILRSGALDAYVGLRVVCLDLGIKRNQLRAMASRGVDITVARYDATVDQMLASDPHGVIISNGPGDPSILDSQVGLVRQLLNKRMPVLGICLGHQILARAIGASTSRLHFGHHGGNHPVKDERTAAVFVTAQNHEFQVDASSLMEGSGWFVSERNLNDGSVEGLRHESLPAFSVQYHPEGAPGPQDRAGVFDEFLDLASGSTITTRRFFPAALAQERLEPVDLSPRVLRSVLVIGSGPVIIGQAAEFDYAGTQACKSLKEEGLRVVLVNSNPATIMTDDDSADAVYVEPLTVTVLERIIEIERPDALLPTLGGQTGLNLAVALSDAGVLDRYQVRVVGTSLNAIKTAEDRDRFKELLHRIGEPAPQSKTVESVAQARELLTEIGLPLVVRPAYTLGGTGGGLCDTEEQFLHVAAEGLAASPISQVLIERSLAGWREIEYEVMRDGAGTAITICNMENLDPMGVHTGDSIVVAPSQTLTDREHQQLRSAALRIISALEIEGGCNVQFALAPDSHEYYVIEVNPRVSRSSALASKATGYPIARVAAKIAAGKRLDEIRNAVTGTTCAAFEPALDYCVVKIPRWPFDKFPTADRRLGTQMKSTGEVMAIERTFPAAMMKALRSLDQPIAQPHELTDPVLLSVANDQRIFAILESLRSGMSPASLAEASGYGAWFIAQLSELTGFQTELTQRGLSDESVRGAKRLGMSDQAIADWARVSLDSVRAHRMRIGLRPTYKSVDTCAAEFEAQTPYYYSTYESEDESSVEGGDPVVVLGSGAIRIGQGIEFDYCSVQAANALKASGHAAIMINCNPETVSTDFDCSTRLYFEPLDEESAVSVVEHERAKGVMVQFGGQTAVNLAASASAYGITVMGTDVNSIDLAEDRSRFTSLLRDLGIAQPPGTATLSLDEAFNIADEVGYPVLVRPSFVLGGRGMEVVHGRTQMESYMQVALAALPMSATGRRGLVLVDKYLAGLEVDVDAICDGETVIIPGLMQHIEQAGVHSGDSMAAYPAGALEASTTQEIVDATIRIARALNVRGLCNIQFVISQGRPYVIEVNPRASRTVPFLSKITGVPMVELATRVAVGERLSDSGWSTGLVAARPLNAVKGPVFSTEKLADVDTVLGPEMKSTGEVMGIDVDFGAAVEKAFLAAFGRIPTQGGVLCSIADRDKPRALSLLERLHQLGFALYATAGTGRALSAVGLPSMPVGRIDLSRPSVLDVIRDGAVSLVINTVPRIEELSDVSGIPVSIEEAGHALKDGYAIREAALRHRIPCCTSLDTAGALVGAIARQKSGRAFKIATVRQYREGLVDVSARSREQEMRVSAVAR